MWYKHDRLLVDYRRCRKQKIENNKGVTKSRNSNTDRHTTTKQKGQLDNKDIDIEFSAHDVFLE